MLGTHTLIGSVVFWTMGVFSVMYVRSDVGGCKILVLERVNHWGRGQVMR